MAWGNTGESPLVLEPVLTRAPHKISAGLECGPDISTAESDDQNLSKNVRAIPGSYWSAPWYRKNRGPRLQPLIPRSSYEQLSEYGQRVSADLAAPTDDIVPVGAVGPSTVCSPPPAPSKHCCSVVAATLLEPTFSDSFCLVGCVLTTLTNRHVQMRSGRPIGMWRPEWEAARRRIPGIRGQCCRYWILSLTSQSSE
eukprot:COSAG05_NODE_908_length_6643_cov_2.923441_7_plen_197_part_00